MGKLHKFRSVLSLILGLVLLTPGAPANAQISSKAVIGAVAAPVQNASKVAFDLGSAQTLDNYTRWWCVSIDNSIPTNASTYVRPWTATDYRDGFLSSWASSTDTVGTERCWRSDFYSLPSAGVLIDLEPLTPGDHNLTISVRGCSDGFISCALSSTELASNVISKTIAMPIAKLVVDQSYSVAEYDDWNKKYDLRELVKKSPNVSTTHMKSWCLKIDGRNFTRDLASPNSVANWLGWNLTWADGCVQVPNPDIDDSQNYYMAISVDPFKIGLGSHTFSMKAELQNGESISIERSIIGTGSLAPHLNDLSAQQRTSDLHLNLGIEWPLDKPVSAEIEWLVDDVSVGKSSVSIGSTVAEKNISAEEITSGTHNVTAKLTTSDGLVVVKQTSIDIDNRPATVTFNPSLDKTYKTGSNVSIAGSFLDAAGFEPSTAKIRTKQFGKPWSAWKTVKVSAGYFSTTQKITLNTAVQVSAISTWDGATYMSQATINVVPAVFKYTESAKRTKVNGFLQGSVVTYKVTADKTYTGTCVMLLRTDYAFNFALVYLGAESKFGYIKLKNGVGSGTVTVKYNGEYDSSILCSAPGYKDVYRANSKWVFGVTH